MIPHEPPAADAAGIRCRRVLLLGFMAAGKTTVGGLLGAALGWRFLDGDAELVRRSGVSVAEWFRRFGEAAFREEEARVTAELCTLDEVVLAPGGGWGVREGALVALPPGTAVVWLRVSPEEALRRAAADTEIRPLLAGADPLGTARQLLAVREPWYQRADHVIDVDGRSAAEVASEILEWLRTSSW